MNHLPINWIISKQIGRTAVECQTQAEANEAKSHFGGEVKMIGNTWYNVWTPSEAKLYPFENLTLTTRVIGQEY